MHSNTVYNRNYESPSRQGADQVYASGSLTDGTCTSTRNDLVYDVPIVSKKPALSQLAAGYQVPRSCSVSQEVRLLLSRGDLVFIFVCFCSLDWAMSIPAHQSWTKLLMAHQLTVIAMWQCRLVIGYDSEMRPSVSLGWEFLVINQCNCKIRTVQCFGALLVH